MKIIAWYLPQFHTIPENDKWWGEGFTEWRNVKNGKQYFPDQYQPKIPLNGNYYNLLDDDVKEWQIQLARENGVYGFAMHHYWFDGHLLLEKPMEQYLANPKLDLPFCVCWANEHWTNQWVADDQKILIEQHYGEEKEWKQHFEYLLPFFQDPRYIRVNKKPLMIIYRPELIGCLNEMVDCWQQLARENNLPGLCMAYQGRKWDHFDKDDSRFELDIEYQPGLIFDWKIQSSILMKIRNCIPARVEKVLERPIRWVGHLVQRRTNRHNSQMSYDEVWQNILKLKPNSCKSVPGAFVNWDNTPRKGKRGIYLSGSSPEKFQYYLEQQIRRAQQDYHKDMIFLFAWNEWAEGGYLEPDEKYQDSYLHAIKRALKNTQTWPWE